MYMIAVLIRTRGASILTMICERQVTTYQPESENNPILTIVAQVVGFAWLSRFGHHS